MTTSQPGSGSSWQGGGAVWARFDDQFPDHPKIEPLSDAAYRLHTTAVIGQCSRFLTDGYVNRNAFHRLSSRWPNAEELANELVEAGLWELCDDGWRIHDYLDWNPSRDKVLEDRSKARARKERFEERRSERVPERRTNVAPSPSVSSPEGEEEAKLRAASLEECRIIEKIGGAKGYDPSKRGQSQEESLARLRLIVESYPTVALFPVACTFRDWVDNRATPSRLARMDYWRTFRDTFVKNEYLDHPNGNGNGRASATPEAPRETTAQQIHRQRREWQEKAADPETARENAAKIKELVATAGRRMPKPLPEDYR